MPAATGGPQAALLAWNRVNEQVRSPQALDNKPPEQLYRDWLKAYSIKKEVLSDIY
jgi:hypothetical protein